MARTPHTGSTNTKDRILDHAIAAFAEHGFSAVSTRALAGAAGVNIGTLSYHFGSKQGVYEAAVALVYQRIKERAALLAPEVLAAGDFRTQIAALVDFSRAHRESVRLLLREVLDGGSLRPETETDHFLPSVEANAALVADAFRLDLREARAVLVSSGFLLSRFVVQSDPSLAQALDVDEAEVRDAVVDIVHRFISAQLQLPTSQ